MLYRRFLLAVLAGLVVSGCSAGAASDRRTAWEPPADPLASAPASAAVPPLHPSIDRYPDATLRFVGPNGEEVAVAAKVANTASRRRHGLMEVPALPAGVGMLFIFPSEERGGFWMKGTLIPLDIAFLGPDRSVHRILRMEPCTSRPCRVYDPGISYRYALEVPAGWFHEVGVGGEWRLELPADLPPAS